MIKCALAVLLLAPLPAVPRAEEETSRPDKRSAYPGPAELVEFAEKSKRSYTVRLIAESKEIEAGPIVDRLWPRNAPPSGYPFIRHGEGGDKSLDYESLDDCHKAMEEADKAFAADEYAKSLPLFLKAAAEQPNCHIAQLYLGDALRMNGKHEQSLAAYEKGIALNPHDYRGPFFRASALTSLGRLEEARLSYARALALRPHHETLLQAIRSRQGELGIEVIDQPFAPAGFARMEGETIALYLEDTESPWWFVFATCKGIWLGEPEFRKERTEETEHHWSTTEETECLAATLDLYASKLEAKEGKPDPRLERALAAARAGLLQEYVLYEIGYRLSTDLMLLLPEQSFADLVRYVETFVIPGVAAKP